MTKFTERERFECKCGTLFYGQNHVTLDDKGNVIKKERVNMFNGPYCPKCNLKIRRE